MKSIIPNTLTLMNLTCGLLAISLVFSNDFNLAAAFMVASLLFDFMDGLAARALGVHSELGKQLDSLADVVSFGVLPGFLLYKVFKLSYMSGEPVADFLPYLAFLVPLFSALRLAKFNIDSRQADYFIGLPTPSNAVFIFALCLTALNTDNETVKYLLLHPFFLIVLTVGTSLLLVAELPLMSLKVKNLSWQSNKGRYVLLIGILILLVLFRWRAIAFIIPLYLILSLIFKPTRQ